MQDMFFPRICPGCGEASDRDGRHLCWNCLRNFSFLTEPVCRRCGEKPEGAVDRAFTCGRCRLDPPAFDQARSAVRFSGLARGLLHGFKYRHQVWLAPDLTDLLEACLHDHAAARRFDAVTSVPLHPSRRRQRTYNQSAMLGKALARRLNLPWRPVVMRHRPTLSQTRLSASARRANVRRAFSVIAPEWVAGRRWLLVDDVATTGATLNEISRILRSHGAGAILAVTVARG